MFGFSVSNTFIYKFANFGRLYFLDSTTFLNQTLELNNFEMHFRVVVKDVRLEFSL